jgi:hypothetical protein
MAKSEKTQKNACLILYFRKKKYNAVNEIEAKITPYNFMPKKRGLI